MRHNNLTYQRQYFIKYKIDILTPPQSSLLWLGNPCPLEPVLSIKACTGQISDLAQIFQQYTELLELRLDPLQFYWKILELLGATCPRKPKSV